jgi:hypothetical protein
MVKNYTVVGGISIKDHTARGGIVLKDHRKRDQGKGSPQKKQRKDDVRSYERTGLIRYRDHFMWSHMNRDPRI